MPVYLALPLLIALSYVLVNVGSKNKAPLAKVALPLVVVCVVVYLASLLLAPVISFLTHIQLP